MPNQFRSFAEFARAMDADSDAEWEDWHDKIQASYRRYDADPSPTMEAAARALIEAVREATMRIALPGDPVKDIAERLARSALRRAEYALAKEEG